MIETSPNPACSHLPTEKKGDVSREYHKYTEEYPTGSPPAKRGFVGNNVGVRHWVKHCFELVGAELVWYHTIRKKSLEPI